MSARDIKFPEFILTVQTTKTGFIEINEPCRPAYVSISKRFCPDLVIEFLAMPVLVNFEDGNEFWRILFYHLICVDEFFVQIRQVRFFEFWRKNKKQRPTTKKRLVICIEILREVFE